MSLCPSGEVRGQGWTTGDIWSRSPAVLSLSPTNTGESVALLLLHLHIPDQPVSGDAGKNVLTWNTFQANPLSSVKPSPPVLALIE